MSESDNSDQNPKLKSNRISYTALEHYTRIYLSTPEIQSLKFTPYSVQAGRPRFDAIDFSSIEARMLALMGGNDLMKDSMEAFAKGVAQMGLAASGMTRTLEDIVSVLQVPQDRLYGNKADAVFVDDIYKLDDNWFKQSHNLTWGQPKATDHDGYDDHSQDYNARCKTPNPRVQLTPKQAQIHLAKKKQARQARKHNRRK